MPFRVLSISFLVSNDTMDTICLSWLCSYNKISIDIRSATNHILSVSYEIGTSIDKSAAVL